MPPMFSLPNQPEVSDADNDIVTFQISDIDVAIVNSIRRTILSDIHNIAFHFDINNKNPQNSDINVEINDSPLHNEFLAQRISMIPIHVSQQIIETMRQEPEIYTFEIHEENNSTTKDLIITSEHIKVYDESNKIIDGPARDLMFPKNSVTNHFITITKLPPTNSVQPTVLKIIMKASHGTAEKSACWSPVSLCTYYNAVDKVKEEKQMNLFVKKHVGDRSHDEIQKHFADNPTLTDEDKKKYNSEHAGLGLTELQSKSRFKTLDYQRAFKTNEFNEPNQFIFKIESECMITPFSIFKTAIESLKNNIQFIISEIGNVNTEKISFETEDGTDLHTITLNNENHTIGNLIQALMYNYDIRQNEKSIVSFVGYSVPHPLDKRVLLKVATTKNSSEEELRIILINSFTKIKETLQDVLEQWNVFTANTTTGSAKKIKKQKPVEKEIENPIYEAVVEEYVTIEPTIEETVQAPAKEKKNSKAKSSTETKTKKAKDTETKEGDTPETEEKTEKKPKKAKPKKVKDTETEEGDPPETEEKTEKKPKKAKPKKVKDTETE